MDFLSQHVIPPSAIHMKLLEFLAVLVYTVHLPYVGLVIGSTAVAMWLTFSDHEIPNSHFARLAADLVQMFIGRTSTILVLGILPLFALPFIYWQWFNGDPSVPLGYVLLAVPGIFVGFALLVMYRRTFAERATRFNVNMGLGTLALAVLTSSYFVLLSAVTRLQDPEKWFRFKNLSVVLLNWNVIWRFLFFMHLAFAITGAGILFFLFRWSGKDGSSDPEYAAFARKFGAGMGLAFCLALPVFYLFYVFTSADVVFDNTVYLLAVAVVFVTMLIAYGFLGTLRSHRIKFAATIFTLFIIVFVLSGSFDLRAMANANREHAVLIEKKVEQEKAEREAMVEEAMAASQGQDLGEQTFKNVCMQCHRMDTKLVGPPLNERLPKYAGNPDALKKFVLNPVKVSPDYPPMPNPGLTPAQAGAVAKYLLDQISSGAPGDSTSGGSTPTQTEVQSGQTSH
jgi:cytochrome c